MGLIDEGAAQPAAAPDDIIAKTRDAFEQRVPADQQDALQRVVLAGKKILYDEKTNNFVEGRLKGDDPASAAGKGAVELIAVLQQESRGTMPKAVKTPAMMVLMTEILDYLKQTGRIKGTAADVDAATRAMSETVMQGTGGNFDQILNKVSQSMNDPNIASAVQQHMQGA